ncbi:MAG: nucleoside monophosphate kinase [Candidatus Doudnabacteria bacterium]|nr:nucleoside monophosphate kinase [Candidatus Doudnabacteria bacterium]
MDLDIIFFIGPQGSGKGTQARQLAEQLGFYHFEMGAILREEAQKDTPLGKHIAELINNGHLLDDEDLYKVMVEKLKELPTDRGIIFDGVPRRVGQAQFLLSYLREHGRTNFVTIFLDIPHDISVARLLERAHHEFRKDDTREAIEYRLQMYDKETLPVIDLLRKETTHIEINGTPSIPEVRVAINTALHLDYV